nr:hypothetical protein [Tropicimonas sp. IMCC34043]
MLIKIVTLFLVGMALMAFAGRLRWPGGAGTGRKDKGKAKGHALPKPRKCPACGAWRVGPGRCACGKE